MHLKILNVTLNVGWFFFLSWLPLVLQRILLTPLSFLGWQQYSSSKAKPYSICIQIAQLIPVILTLQFVYKHTFPLLIMAMIRHISLMIKIRKKKNNKSILMTMKHWGNLFTIDFRGSCGGLRNCMKCTRYIQSDVNINGKSVCWLILHLNWYLHARGWKKNSSLIFSLSL